MKILVTGATGFVGINVVKRLSRKYSVSVFVRRMELAKKYLDNVEIYEGNVLDYNSLERALGKGFDLVIHIAGLISAHNIKKLYDVNRLGCRNVAFASSLAGVKDFIYISSLAARGPDGYGHPISHYGNSKRLGELEIISINCFRSIKIVRPPIIFGPYDKGLLPLFRLAKIGILPGLDRVYSFLYIDDLAKIIERLIQYKKGSYSFFYASSFTLHLESFERLLLKAAGKKGVIFPLPLEVIKIAAFFSRRKSPLTKDKVREILPRAWTCDNKSIKEKLSFEPETDPFDSVKKTYEWYVDNGWI